MNLRLPRKREPLEGIEARVKERYKVESSETGLQSTVEQTPRKDVSTLIVVLLVLGVVLSTIDIIWTFTIAPMVKGAGVSGTVLIGDQVVSNKLLFSQKIFYLHVPVAIASFGIFALTAINGFQYLRTKDRKYDIRARVATEVTLVFVLATMVSGDLWTRFEWGVWWVWEPRLTTYFIMTLLVIGYFVLRTAIDDPERRAQYAAVFGIIAFIDAPISFFITRMVPTTLHPVVFRTDSGLPPDMLIPFLLGLFGVLMIAAAFYQHRLRIEEDAARVEDMKEELEDLLIRAERARK